MRRWTFPLSVVLFLGLTASQLVGLGASLIAAEPAAVVEDAVQKELQRFAGTWVVQSWEADGVAVTNEALIQIEFVFEKTTCTLQSAEKTLLKAEIQIDPGTMPPVIDLILKPGPDRSSRLEGIYQFQGETLRWCAAPPAKDRPVEFVTKPGSEHSLVVLKRKKG